ncbi:sporulation integral membrane protein YtvI [Oceanobacillus manasiensis]|uniref:sporulation integral membrane protein YtvI n=1 Tax=Oceanobacillus manasiensis TaxID=586413 RepID=UPI0005A96337|nr:sporulation integral membrane protein YtvI [Oceanobacillus manasiensis]
MYKQLPYQLMRFFIVIILCTVLLLIFHYAAKFIYPLIIAVALSLGMHPAVTFLQKRFKFPRVIATLTVLVAGFLTFISFIFFLVNEIVHGVISIADKIPGYFSKGTEVLDNLTTTYLLPFYQKLASLLHTLDEEQQITIREKITDFANNIAVAAAEFLQQLLLTIPAFISTLPNSVTIIIFIVFAAYIITNDWDTLRIKVKSILPNRFNDSGKQIMIQLKKATVGYIKAQITLIFITFVIILIGLIILQVDHPLTIAFLAACVDLLPYVGTGILFIPWILYLYMTGNFPLTIGLIIIYMIIVILRQILEPKVLATSIGLHPLAALIILFVGVQMLGMLGFLIAPILLILVNAFYKAEIPQRIWHFILKG